jgi:hypothetical protein
MLGSFYSLFSRQVINANGTVLETIERPGELINMLVNMTMNQSEKEAQSNSMGTNFYGNIGDVKINSNTTADQVGGSGNNNTLSFAFPVIGIFDATKYIPMWNTNIDVELTVNAITNFLVATAGAFSATAAFTLSNLELVFDSIELSPESFAMVMANYPQKVVIKTNSYLAGSSTSFSGSGAQDIPINARLSSLKQLFFYFNQIGDANTACADKTFGGVNPNGQDVVFITNGKYYPQRPIKLTNPSEVYMQIQKSFGSIKTYSHSGSILKQDLCRREAANSLYAVTIKDPTVLSTNGNKFYLAIDTEIINTNKDSLYNGIQTGVNSTIRLNIANSLTASMVCYYWCCYDVLLEMDFLSGITRAIY